jgi:hypothetical protein
MQQGVSGLIALNSETASKIVNLKHDYPVSRQFPNFRMSLQFSLVCEEEPGAASRPLQSFPRLQTDDRKNQHIMQI